MLTMMMMRSWRMMIMIIFDVVQLVVHQLFCTDTRLRLNDVTVYDGDGHDADGDDDDDEKEKDGDHCHRGGATSS